ncbi:hypothetical protein GCWU000341_00336 [Oribacterium sp. oral taxon 078 str. F0262]|nr:hypothetical protein GCWU000341_00336 [Oribacterium sp. oral taxon 078 str. F0262]
MEPDFWHRNQYILFWLFGVGAFPCRGAGLFLRKNKKGLDLSGLLRYDLPC